MRTLNFKCKQTEIADAKMDPAKFKVRTGRFGSTTDEEKQKIKEERTAKNTNRATKSSVACLMEYIAEKEIQFELKDIPLDDLPKILEDFYCNARTKNNDYYNNTSFKSLRSNLNRWFKENRNINIVTNERFTSANNMFQGMMVKAKKQGKGYRRSTPVISDEDLLKIGQYFDVDHVHAPNPKILQQTVLFYVIYFFCRRGQENLYEMQKNHFAVKFANGVRFIEQSVDELDKNHRENFDKLANQARMYEKPGK